jgi:hypothetical protein
MEIPTPAQILAALKQEHGADTSEALLLDHALIEISYLLARSAIYAPKGLQPILDRLTPKP